MRKHLLMAVALATMASTFGCAGMKDKLCYTRQGALAGAAVGASSGALLGAWAGGHVAEGAILGAVSGGLGGVVIGGLIGDMDHHKEIAELKARVAELESQLAAKEAELKACQDKNAALMAEIEALRKKLADCEANSGKPLATIALPNTVLFKSGSAKLTDEGKRLLDDAVAKIKELGPDKMIVVEGHTDSDPIVNSGWKSNWELGAARSLAVVHYLQDSQGIAGESLNAATGGEYHPAAGNDTAEGKATNRRTLLMVHPKK